MATRNYTNSAQPQLLTSALNNTDTTSAVSVGSTSTFPTAPFIITIDRGLSTQEVMLCTAKASSTTFTVTRGYNGSAKSAHSPNAIVEHTAAAIDYAEPNTFINTYTSAGDLVQGTSTSGVVSRLAIGTQGQVLTSNGTGISWATAPTNTGPQGAQGVPGPATVPPYMFVVPGSGSATSFGNGAVTTVPLTYAVQSLGGANIPTLAGNTITFPLQGVYQFSASVGITNTDTANYITAQVVTKDGGSASDVTYIGSSGRSGVAAGQGGQSHVSGTVKFTLANSTIKLRAQAWSGGTDGALNYGQTSPYQTYLTVHYVGPIA